MMARHAGSPSKRRALNGFYKPAGPARGTPLAKLSRGGSTMGIRIVLADDHAVVRSGVRLFLEMAGFEVIGEAADGLEAVNLVRALNPDVAVLDRAMPLLNGIDAAREI